MKEKEFDSLIKTKADSVDTLIGNEFEHDVVWKKVRTNIPKNTNRRLYFFVAVVICTLMGILCFLLFAPNDSVEEKEILVPVKTKDAVVIDTIVNKEEEVVKKTKSVTSKTNDFKNKPIKKKLTIENNQRIITKDTGVIINKLIPKLIDSNSIDTPSKISNKNKLYKVDFAKITETRAYVHVYRPSKGIVGALNYFTFKANGRKIGTISNGEYEVFMVESGLTEFEIKRKKITINLEARKSYYLRTELVFLGKTKFERVTES